MADHGHSPEEIRARVGGNGANGSLRDAIYGGIDGAVTTFAIVAGVAGAGLSPFVIVALGLANVLADGFSMAAANYSGIKAEQDNARRLRKVEGRHIDRYPKGEWLEAREILARKGLSGQVLDDATDEITHNREKWIDLMIEGEYGISGAPPNPLHGAIVTFVAFLAAGSVPLLPFLFGMANAFAWSAGMTLAGFFAIGTAKSRWSLTPWWRSGLETLAIGGTAALIAYGVGSLFTL